MRSEVQLASRHLRSGGWQTVLIAAGVAMAVTLVIFVSGLIHGMQEQRLSIRTGPIAHVQVSAAEPEPRTLREVRPPAGEDVAVSRAEQRAQQREEIEQWRPVVPALANQPRLVLADEPTGNLDSVSDRQVYDLMRAMNRDFGIAFIMVTHDDRLAEEAERIFRITDVHLSEDRPHGLAA